MIVPYTTEDIPQIIECLSQLQDAEHGVEPNRRTGIEVARDYFEEIHQQLNDKDGMIFVAKQDNQVLGIIIMFVEQNGIIEVPGKHIYISDIITRESHRRQGIAARLMHQAEEFAKEKGVSEIRITVLAKNTAALNLYKKTSYQEHEITLIKKKLNSN